MIVDMISVKDIKKYIYKNDVVIVDLRDKSEYMQGHIPTAIRIYYEDMYDDFGKYKSLLSKSKIIIVYCERGNNGMKIARYISTQLNGEYRIYNVYGGYEAYKSIINNI